jgi:hypothetical protein
MKMLLVFSKAVCYHIHQKSISPSVFQLPTIKLGSLSDLASIVRAPQDLCCKNSSSFGIRTLSHVHQCAHPFSRRGSFFRSRALGATRQVRFDNSSAVVNLPLLQHQYLRSQCLAGVPQQRRLSLQCILSSLPQLQMMERIN